MRYRNGVVYQREIERRVVNEEEEEEVVSGRRRRRRCSGLYVRLIESGCVWEGKGHEPVRQDWEAEDRAIDLGGS